MDVNVALPRHPFIENRPFKWVVYSSSALILLAWLALTPDGLLGKADAVAYAVCHRIATHSFFFADRQLPLCARCTGMYLGAVLGLAFQHFQGRRAGLPILRYSLLFGPLVILFGVDGVNSYMHLIPGAPGLYTPQNWLRLATGTGMGLAIAAVLAPAFRQTVWASWDELPAFNNLKAIGLVVILAVLVDLAVLSGNPLLLYPLALTSAAGVLLILGTVYSMVLVMLFKVENRFLKLGQLPVYTAGGFGLALLQIAVIDFGRFWLTGTWQGFHF